MTNHYFVVQSMARVKTVARWQYQCRVRQRVEEPEEHEEPALAQSERSVSSASAASSSSSADKAEHIQPPSPPPAQPGQVRDRPIRRYSHLSVAHESVFDTVFFSQSILTKAVFDEIDRRGISAILAPVGYPIYLRLVPLFYQNLQPTPSNL
ncbi:uncharacterized protein LOC132267113 isoform X2 [Cornus florida]|uniref:uncharacterized protein LOC132267113 isoform X2 n=1 Tax=Cornus florida TaxID=4283 RepID=UPI00289F9746|nr:uncharacterized protein LOC132267113 isoform X2 [Cornus florida]